MFPITVPTCEAEYSGDGCLGTGVSVQKEPLFLNELVLLSPILSQLSLSLNLLWLEIKVITKTVSCAGKTIWKLFAEETNSKLVALHQLRPLLCVQSGLLWFSECGKIFP